MKKFYLLFCFVLFAYSVSAKYILIGNDTLKPSFSGISIELYSILPYYPHVQNHFNKGLGVNVGLTLYNGPYISIGFENFSKNINSFDVDKRISYCDSYFSVIFPCYKKKKTNVLSSIGYSLSYPVKYYIELIPYKKENLKIGQSIFVKQYFEYRINSCLSLSSSVLFSCKILPEEYDAQAFYFKSKEAYMLCLNVGLIIHIKFKKI